MQKILFGITATALAAGAAIAQPAPSPRGAFADGVLTRAEAAQQAQTRFARLDANRDGVLTQQESQNRRAAKAGNRGERRQHAQRDPQAQAQRSAAAFDRLDSNRDGQLSRAEFSAGRELRAERRGQRGMRAARRGFGGKAFAGADLNRDGQVTIQEATNAAMARFDRADANRDGQVTREERRQARGANRRG